MSGASGGRGPLPSRVLEQVAVLVHVEREVLEPVEALVEGLRGAVVLYGRAGIYADVALVLNLVLIFGILAGLGAVLTLPGIAGIVLTIGMSVDANVLIFERIREELRKGKGIKKSVGDGFSNALSSILDANITTGLTALILFVFGSGPIKGFATTLLIGIATSLFTAIFITRMLVDSRLSKTLRTYTTTSLCRPCPQERIQSTLITSEPLALISGRFGRRQRMRWRRS